MIRTAAPRTLLCLALLTALPPALSAGQAAAAPDQPAAGEYLPLAGGDFRSSLRLDDAIGPRHVAPFQLMREPVSNRQFEAFLAKEPRWRRDRIARVFADNGYLAHWASADAAGADEAADAPVRHVSWFVADAYCRSQGARLPDWLEWEFAAAADATRHDAREDRAWRMRLVADGSPRAIDAAADAPANAYGIRNLHGRQWEWVGDYSTLMAGSDKRGQDDGDRLRFCGATALSFTDREDYAVLKRVALLSALQSNATLGNLGFRCAKDPP
ncbi:formylglycine-generating enzyme family protein [Xanthomonas sp. XNM01]|uniref:formylglycine-generating enzyme family protein n=1 Tax=Xanthomonas sp. XNM01 TaxID=2769289 RepID=UPI001782D0D8|nr:formylglycine-generating enzyme family protein [Xanthomonas sp. XNM01]MBD9367087.1 formylglycine-generating enzyme family protein [Xanthomonas sp. XNM01]